MSRFDVYVVPRSTKPGPDGRHGGLPRLRLKAAPADGRANAEAERLLTDLLGTRVRLVSGQRSRRKLFDADLGEVELAARLNRAFP